MTQKQTIPWVDLIRVVACFLVVLAHCCDPFVAQFDANRTDFLSGAFWGSALRVSVPLFMMISGVLLLPVKMDMGQFYRRRLSRVAIPLAIWSVITPLLFYLYLNFGVQTLSLNIAMADHTWQATLTKMWSWVFNFNYDTTPLWYIYMLVGLYLFMPIISSWMEQASKHDIQYFLAIWLITLCLPYLQILAPVLGYTGNYGNMGLLGVCDWNPYGMLYNFSGFLGYIVLAYYLMRFPLEWSWRKTWMVAVPMMVVGYAITLGGFLVTQKYFPGNYAALEIVWYFSGINVFMMTFAVYIVLSRVKLPPLPWLRQVASLTFGVYLCHFIFVLMGYDMIYGQLELPAWLLIPLNAIIAFGCALLFTWVLNKIPYLRRMVS
ncbi:MAG: acyltransferase [Mucinivorans sp.]